MLFVYLFLFLSGVLSVSAVGHKVLQCLLIYFLSVSAAPSHKNVKNKTKKKCINEVFLFYNAEILTFKIFSVAAWLI